jgi:hypothetical protein
MAELRAIPAQMAGAGKNAAMTTIEGAHALLKRKRRR